MRSTSRAPHVCPWWLIRAFDNPVRRLFQHPEKTFRGMLRPGDSCLDVGCGYGYFTIPMARLVGPSGRVTAVDLQPEMLEGARRRAEKAGLLDRIRFHRADETGLGLDGTFDFALAFWMAHEVPDQPRLFRQIRNALNPGGRLLLAEPKGHVRRRAFDRTVVVAENAGFVRTSEIRVPFSRAVLLAGGPERADSKSGDCP